VVAARLRSKETGSAEIARRLNTLGSMDLESVLVEAAVRLASFSRDAAELQHNGLVGRTREEVFGEVLGRQLLPARFGIGSGRVVGIGGRMSREADIVFYDTLDCPRFLGGKSAIFPSLGVYGIAEIKSTLNKAEMEDAIAKIAAFKLLYEHEPRHPFGSRHIARQGSEPRPFGVIFGFSAATSLETLRENLLEAEASVPQSQRAELVVVNNRGLIARSVDGIGANSVWAHTGAGFPPHTIVLKEGVQSFGHFYQLLSELLASVNTFPVNPALYERLLRLVDGHEIAGQSREIDADTMVKTSFTDAFLRTVIADVATTLPTTMSLLEQIAFGTGATDYTSFGDGTVWLFDPESKFSDLAFTPRSVPGVGEVRSLASGCLVLTIDDKPVLIPRPYLAGSNVDTVDRI
jgi:uncharacterized protein DUF6602